MDEPELDRHDDDAAERTEPQHSHDLTQINAHVA
jgi:hypothetical protein